MPLAGADSTAEIKFRDRKPEILPQVQGCGDQITREFQARVTPLANDRTFGTLYCRQTMKTAPVFLIVCLVLSPLALSQQKDGQKKGAATPGVRAVTITAIPGIVARRPGRLQEEVKIALPRPRTLALKRTAEFVALVDRIWRMIEDDVRAAALYENA